MMEGSAIVHFVECFSFLYKFVGFFNKFVQVCRKGVSTKCSMAESAISGPLEGHNFGHSTLCGVFSYKFVQIRTDL